MSSYLLGLKTVLYLICFKFGKGESIAALKNDQMNDALSNSIALVFSTLSARIGKQSIFLISIHQLFILLIVNVTRDGRFKHVLFNLCAKHLRVFIISVT